MTASADTAPNGFQPNRGPKFQVLGTGDGNDGAFATGIVLIDPASGSPYAATAGNASSTVALHDTATPSRGATVTTTHALQVAPVADPGNGASYAACPAAGTTTAKASAGVLKALCVAGTGTAGTVALVDGSTTIFTAGIPAAVGTWSLPLPPEGVAFGTSIKVTTSGTGVTALCVFA